MSESHSDAFVFFGATGDLAYKKIFPSLQAMVRRGHLSVPVIALGVMVHVSGDGMRGTQTELVAFHHVGKDEMDAYERLLGDALSGDATLFAREDYVEEAW